MALTAAACTPAQDTGQGPPADNGSTPPDETGRDRPAVQVPARGGPPKPPLDPDADPGTALGRLRAQHLPVWTPDFDWAFPPETCDSAWELDSIAEPAPNADTAALGDFAVAAALAVMRYEHQYSRALADPSALAQLCVAVASVDPARSESLDVLASHLATGSRRAGPAAYPQEVAIVAVSETAAVAVACITPGYPDMIRADAAAIEPARPPARLAAYHLPVSRGLEDQITDISYRVSDTAHRPAQNCDSLDAWANEWNGHMQTWIAEGQIWEPLGAILTAEEICESPPPDGPDECPRDWPQ